MRDNPWQDYPGRRPAASPVGRAGRGVQAAAGALPTPPQLFRMLEQGEITHRQLQQAMACHALMLFEEISECRRNPLLEFIEHRLNRRLADRLMRQHGEGRIRAILMALAEVRRFPPARFLWHAASPNVPLDCILRTRKEPVFRILAIEDGPGLLEVVKLEHGPAKRRQAIREHFVLDRQPDGRRSVVSRQWVD